MAVGRLDAFSIQRQVGASSVVEKATEKVEASQGGTTGATEASKEFASSGVHITSDPRNIGPGDGVIQKSSDNVGDFIRGQLDGSGTQVNISA